MRNYLCFPLFVVVCCVVFAGCGDSGGLHGLAPCEGIITYNGSPVVDAVVTFSPESSGANARSATASTNASGKFVMTTLKKNDGVYPGNYTICICQYEFYGEAPPPIDLGDGEMQYPPRPQRNTLPAKYENPGTSGLKLSVPSSGDKKVKFELVN